MKVKAIVTAAVALMLSAGAYAQSQTEVYKVKPKRSPEEQAARKLARKDQLAKMTPEERKAFKQAHRARKQARLNVMTPERRAKVLARRQHRKMMKHREG